MSLTVGPAFTIPGYTVPIPPDYEVKRDAIVYAADALVRLPAFWVHYLSDPLSAYPAAEAAFEVSANDRNALWTVLNDLDRWPVVSVRLGAQEWLRIVYRKYEDERALDFVQERPGRAAEVVASVEGHGFTSAMTWAELLAAAALPDKRQTWAQRLLLMLPMLGAQELSEDAEEIMRRALSDIGAANRPALARPLVDRREWRKR
ncbi:hypothetical protein [Actinoplanes aureus]|uniref:Uncharacterized protein n=1 Tax=Actinoplanes aureus TaxID=2792083 RepID=A0A931CHX4_9ACTN|nr:hypothetical protein [Actinoplanes aureus]MBG0566478.1 hypothetical protein [Actinoplanes aureus]